MYMRIAALVPVAALAAVAAAAPNALEARSTTTSSCDTGSIQCCTQTYTQSEYESLFGGLLTLLGINLSNTEGLVGTQCTDATACTQQPVCCTGNNFSGLIVVGCSPITINA